MAQTKQDTIDSLHVAIRELTDSLTAERRRREALESKVEGGTLYPKGYNRAKLSFADVQRIRLKVRNGESSSSVAREYNVNRATVTRIANRQYYSEVA